MRPALLLALLIGFILGNLMGPVFRFDQYWLIGWQIRGPQWGK